MLQRGPDLVTILAVAGAAALASPVGGLVALWRQPTTLFMSIALGFASGVLLATVGFGMLPQALELSSLPVAVGGFLVGVAAIHAFDLFVHRGVLAGREAEQRQRVIRFHRKHRPRGSDVTVLAGGTSVEELIEGLAIGMGVVVRPGLGLIVGLAIFIDNLAEGLSVGELIRAERSKGGHEPARILGWTSLIGTALLVSALAGWFFLRGASMNLIGFLLASGAGGMLYLTIADLVPQAEERQYQQSAALATAAGFAAVFVLSQFL